MRELIKNQIKQLEVTCFCDTKKFVKSVLEIIDTLDQGSEPTEAELSELKDFASKGDDEAFHAHFDDMIERKLRQLDPEWMKAMEKFYEKSGMDRWCA